MAACLDMTGYRTLPVKSWRNALLASANDHVAQEVPIALVYNGISQAVMMATPLDLEDFALGFSIAEDIVENPGEIRAIETETTDQGIQLHLEISSRRFAALKERRRTLAGRSGCGLCGIESLQQVARPPRKVQHQPPPPAAAVENAVSSLEYYQPIKSLTGSLHAAAWCGTDGEVLLVREDVGRHNALDKLIGALAAEKSPRPDKGFALISSRAGFEMVQKASMANIATLIAVSAPTTLAIELANRAGLNLLGFARPGQYVLYTETEA
ncbi:MAG: formate dehydrogenase accessory sulfurtransferase FdhD [Gammaproteobacteria bacterium]|nr:formate dehydrogenase accessory sulfurtransferase FdhD [Gammaproteobacteria bacterium]